MGISQADVKFKDEIWIGVLHEYTPYGTNDKGLFGHIFKNGSYGFDLTNKDIEFEVAENQTTGQTIFDERDIPREYPKTTLTFLEFNYENIRRYRENCL